MNKNIIFLWMLLIASNNSNACWTWLCGGDSADVARPAEQYSVVAQALGAQEAMRTAQEPVHQVQVAAQQASAAQAVAQQSEIPFTALPDARLTSSFEGVIADVPHLVTSDDFRLGDTAQSSRSSRSSGSFEREGSVLSIGSTDSDIESPAVKAALAGTRPQQIPQRFNVHGSDLGRSGFTISIISMVDDNQQDLPGFVQAGRAQSNAFVSDGGAETEVVSNAYLNRQGNSQATPSNVVHVVVTDTSAPRRDGDVLYLPSETNPCFQDGQCQRTRR